jgi:hypothetical protein
MFIREFFTCVKNIQESNARPCSAREHFHFAAARQCGVETSIRRLTAPPDAATTHEKNMYHVKLAVKVLSTAPEGTAPLAIPHLQQKSKPSLRSHKEIVNGRNRQLATSPLCYWYGIQLHWPSELYCQCRNIPHSGHPFREHDTMARQDPALGMSLLESYVRPMPEDTNTIDLTTGTKTRVNNSKRSSTEGRSCD